MDKGPQFNPEDMGIDKEEQENMEMRGKIGAMGDSGDHGAHILGAHLSAVLARKKFYSQMVDPIFYVKHNLGVPLDKVADVCDTFENKYTPTVDKAEEAHNTGNTSAALQHLMEAHGHLQTWHSHLSRLMGPDHPAISHISDTLNEHADYVANYANAIA